jgi:hypothetical protein
MRKALVLAIVVAAACAPAPAAASRAFGDRAVTDPTLKVNAAGTALVEYTLQTGRPRHVLVWGAVNGLPHRNDESSTQQKFQMDYSGGWKSKGNARYWRSFRNVCGAYDGPPLPYVVAACKAPDGTYWALQSWQRNLPMRGFDPWLDRQSASELHVSHWSGEVPVLEIHRHWTYGDTLQGFFGRLTYAGEAVYGTRSASASVGDVWARNISIDTFNSDYGPGWKHDTAISTHVGNGGFCYSFVPQPPPKGYPSADPRGNGLGERYRVTVMGPGVMPIVQWEGERLHGIDREQQAQATRRFDELLGADRHCAPER